MNSASKIKAVLFDLDGTIIKSIELIAICWSKAFKNVGLNVKPHDIYKVVGLPADTILEKFTKTNDTSLHRSILKYARKCFEENMNPDQLLYREVLDVIKHLKENNKLCGIVTSSSCRRAMDLLRQTNIINLFDVIQCYREGLRGKPYPDLLLTALDRLNVKPEQAVYVGDAFVDYLAARSAGVLFILVKREWNIDIINRCDSSCIVINDLREIYELVL